MKRLQRSLVLLMLLFLAACGNQKPSIQPTPQATPSLPPPGKFTTQAPPTEPAARAYLEAWSNEEYAKMYTLLTQVSIDALTHSVRVGDHTKRPWLSVEYADVIREEIEHRKVMFDGYDRLA